MAQRAINFMVVRLCRPEIARPNGSDNAQSKARSRHDGDCRFSHNRSAGFQLGSGEPFGVSKPIANQRSEC